jgi:hypothetical protein
MEEKMSRYTVALDNAKTGSEDFFRIQKKISDLQKKMPSARGADFGSTSESAGLTAESLERMRQAVKNVAREFEVADEDFDKILEQWDKDLQNSLEDFEPESDQLATNYLYWLESTYEGRKELLKQQLKDMVISYDEYSDKIKAIDREMNQNKVKNFEDYAGAVLGMTGAISDFMEASKTKELAIHGKTDKAKEQIEKKYAKRQRALAIFETAVQGLIEIARINSNAGVNADLTQTLRIVLTAAAIARTAGTIAMISAQKYAKGKYPVMDPYSSRSYQTAFVGPIQTGLYKKPSLGIFSEEEPEMVIDGPTTRNLMTNFPEILSAIMDARVGHFASGLYPDQGSTSNQSQIRDLLMVTIETMLQVKKSHERPGTVSFQSIRQAQREYDAIQESVNL